jgi:peptidoglycan hydrolase-like protein with peptidoglycan-binding domain
MIAMVLGGALLAAAPASEKPPKSKKTTLHAAAGRTRKKSKGARTRKAAGPSYQLHPDPERYQQIQQALADRGYYKGAVDGNWNADSVDALKRFQADQKLEADGRITALTLTGLGLGPKHDGSSAGTVPLSAAEPGGTTAQQRPEVPPVEEIPQGNEPQ